MRLATMRGVRLPNHSVKLMTDLLREMGLDPDVAADGAHIAPEILEDTKGEINGVQEFAYQRAFYMQTYERPDLWIELGRRYNMLTHAHVSYSLALATAANLRQMFDITLGFGDLHYTLADTELLQKDGQLIGFRSHANEVPENLRQFTMLRDLASGSVIFRDLWGRNFPLLRVETAISPSYEKLVSPFFGNVPVTFNATSNAWFWPMQVDEQPLPQSNALLHEHFRRECETILQSAHTADDVVPAIEAEFRVLGLDASLAEVAQRIGRSVRTLQRRLSEQNMTFREVTNQARHRRAREMLIKSHTDIASIAWELGYQNVASFTRAFRLHAGMAPGAFRRTRRFDD